jgi:flagellar assembly factor FliW
MTMPTSSSTTAIHLAHGLVGLHDLKRFELIRDPEAAPFLRLCSLDDPEIEFVAIEPAGWVPDYAVEVGDDEAEELHIDPVEADAQVLSLVTVHRSAPLRLTVNLLAPLVVNRETGEGRQVVMSDAKRFSTAHPLAGIDG